MLASVLQESGYKTGLYNSPHLIDFTERIKINGENCDKEFVYHFIQKLKDLPEDISNYYLDLGKLISKECPYQKKHYTLTISKVTGTINFVKDNGSYIELYNKKCTNNPRLLKIEKKEEPKDEPKKPTKSTKRR